jgi:dihydroorotate dehydrogenase (fumarate)
MAGADAVQMVSALLAREPAHLRTVCAQMQEFLEQHGYTSLREVQGCMSLAAAPDPAVHERAYYMTGLQAWSPA